jgi:hypothetical protein
LTEVAPQLEKLLGVGLWSLLFSASIPPTAASPFTPPSLPCSVPLSAPADFSLATDDLEEQEGALVDSLKRFSGIICLLFSKTTCGKGKVGFPGPFSGVAKLGSLVNSDPTAGGFAFFVELMTNVVVRVPTSASTSFVLVSSRLFSNSFFSFFLFGAFLNVTLSTPIYLRYQE